VQPENRHPNEITIVHTSDLHLGTHGERDDLEVLRRVLTTAAQAHADAVLLAGDVFDTNRLPLSVIERVARMIADAALPVVILPGNHDPATADSAYRKGGLGDPSNVHVLGVTCDDVTTIPELGLEIFGRPHMDYVDMAPIVTPNGRALPHQIVMAHGHFVRAEYDLHRSWLVHETDIDATHADYVALGHWELSAQVGSGAVEAHYSGSPHRAGTVNVVRLNGERPAVERLSVRPDDVERRQRALESR
jgi:DNA repair exonuclease SbcCD nuclease subunit